MTDFLFFLDNVGCVVAIVRFDTETASLYLVNRLLLLPFGLLRMSWYVVVAGMEFGETLMGGDNEDTVSGRGAEEFMAATWVFLTQPCEEATISGNDPCSCSLCAP